MQKRELLGVLGMLMMFANIPAWAQDTGILSGQVHDSSGAVIANAKVTLSTPRRISKQRPKQIRKVFSGCLR
jgi:hypothetical protein